MGCSFDSLFYSVSSFFQKRFEQLGEFVGRHSKFLIPICLILSLGLGIGMLNMDEETDIEVLYTPVNSRAVQDRTKYQEVFQDATGSYFLPYAAYAEPLYADVIFSAKGQQIFSYESAQEMRRNIAAIKATTVDYEGETLGFADVCALRNGQCVVSGELLTDDDAVADFLSGSLTFPTWKGVNINGNIGDKVTADGKVTSAKHLRVVFYLRQNTDRASKKSKAWEVQALDVMSNLTAEVNDLYYEVSQSLTWEVDSNTAGDITLFIITFTIMIVYACIVVGGDPVSARTWAACAGILAALLGVVSSLGLVSVFGVKYVNIVGVVPYLIIGIGVDDMFLLMSSWADTYSDKDYSVVYRMGQTFRSAGIGITITSLTDLLAFVVGYSSAFISVQNFCLYMGVAVIFCYIYQCLLFGSCLALHGHRVDQNRHCVTCRVTKSRGQLRDEGKSWLKAFCCGGSRPTKRGQDERYIEKLPRIYLPKLILNRVGNVFVGLLYIAYLAVSIWGLFNFKQGLDLKDLSSKSSYYFKHREVLEGNFDAGSPVAFVFESDTRYVKTETIQNMKNLFEEVELNNNIEENSLLCWLNGYRASPFYDGTTEGNFVAALKLYLAADPRFRFDVVFDETGTSIVASRCFFFTKPSQDSNAEAATMTEIREIADASPVTVYAFQPFFVYFEQFVTILPSTLQTVGIALAVMTIITFVFLPHPFLVFIVFVNISSITVGIFGFLHVWNISLSSVTMIQLIMSIGFSVDFSVHVCTAFILSDAPTRKEKTKSAIVHAVSPILNATLSSFFGIIVLLLSESYIFQAFFKVMFTVLLFGAIHAVLFMPVVLSLIGPLSKPRPPKSGPSSKMKSTDQKVPPKFHFASRQTSLSQYDNWLVPKIPSLQKSTEYEKPPWFSSSSSKPFEKTPPVDYMISPDRRKPPAVRPQPREKQRSTSVKRLVEIDHTGGVLHEKNIKRPMGTRHSSGVVHADVKYSIGMMNSKDMKYQAGRKPAGVKSPINHSLSVDDRIYAVYTGRKYVSSLQR